MRLINRNCFRKTSVLFSFFAISLFIVLLIQTQNYNINVNQMTKEDSSNTKSDKNWEWSQERLNDFMHILNKYKGPIINTTTVFHYINSTNNSYADNRLQFPLLKTYLPFITDEDSALIPAYTLSKRNANKKASIVLGVPHIKRSKESYLQLTLYFLVKNLRPEDFADTLIIVFIAETDVIYVKNTTDMIVRHFKDYVDSGVLTVLSPSKSYYPDFEQIYKKKTLGDPLKRVHWRTKQNLDFAYLMMYAYSRGHYYVQLEDDVISSPNYVQQIKQTIIDLEKNHTEWFTIRFCRLGFIGQMLKSKDLPQLISFLLIFHEDQPSDWLLDYLIQTRVCRKDKDTKHCKTQKDLLWRTNPTSLFQHIGYHSSLDGKVQKLKDKFFKSKSYLYFAHKDNPTAKVITSLKAYQKHDITKAYEGEDLFWSTEPKTGDNITFIFTPHVVIDEIVFQSGNFDHVTDKALDGTSVEILPLNAKSDNQNLNITNDGFYIIGYFYDGFIRVDNMKKYDLIKELRITFHTNSKFWLILSEMQIKAIK